MRGALALVIIFVWTTILRAETLPNTVFDPIWQDAYDFIATEGVISSRVGSTQPLLSDDLRTDTRVEAWTPLSRALFRRVVASPFTRVRSSLYGRFSAELRSRPEQTPRVQPAFRAAFRYENRFVQEWDIAPASGLYEPVAGGETASRRVRAWNPEGAFGSDGYAADFHRVFARVFTDPVTVTLGRQSYAWGPGRTGNLLLSDASPSLDGISMSSRRGNVYGVAVFAALNTTWHDDGARRYLARRYFAAHRLGWASERLAVAVMDAVLYGGDARPMEWRYLNPLLPFYASQYNAGTDENPDFQDDNALIGFDARWNPRRGLSLYGEFLVDDFRYDPDSNDPHALAGLVGVHKTGVAERGEARIEYARVGRYAYTHLVPEQQYTHFGASLGYPTGNDSDRLSVVGAWWLSPDARAAIEFRQQRKGDSGVDDRFRGEADTSFLNGIAETRRSLALNIRCRSESGFRLDASSAAVRVRSRNHIKGDNATLWETRADAAYEFDIGKP